jgi:TP901 family phage tail tape measure protein
MADRRVKVTFSAEIQGFKRAMEEAAQSTQKVSKASQDSSKAADTYLGKMVESANKNRDAWEKSGTVLLGVGTAAVAGLGLAGKAAMDWESAWAGVTKTVDGTPAQMNELEASLRGLAKTLPATHEEIAGVAEAAGQLGVKRADVVGFTKTMIDLGETTNLTAEEAATSIAQISNVMGTMERDGSKGVERFGATLVALGNAGASTEAEILEMAKRIAGAAKLVGASESDVLALSNAMASVGIEAQLGGGVISRVMQRMYGDVKEGGEGLENLAKVAGVSSKDFATAFETDPVRAVDMMIKGLSRVKDTGGDVIQTMSDLGIKGTEETGVILRLAGAGDLLADSLKLGDEAWQSNSALAEEAAKRYETTESKVKVAWNNIKDAAIEAGAVLLPIIAGVAESVAGMAQAFGNLPDPVKGVLTVLGSVAGVAALGAGAFLTLTPKILDTMNAFNQLAPAGSKARGALVSVGKAAGGALAIGTVVTILAKLAESDYMADIDTGMGRVALALADIADNSPGAAAGLDSLFKDRDGGNLINGVDDLNTAMQRTFNKNRDQEFNDWGEGLVNAIVPVEGSVKILEGAFDRVDQTLADLVSGGNPEDAAKAFEKIEAAAKVQGATVEELAEKFPQYRDALAAAEAAAKTAGTETETTTGAIEAAGAAAESAAVQAEDIAKALEDVGLNADGSIDDLNKFTEALLATGLITLSARDAARNWSQALLDMGLQADGTGGQIGALGTEFDNTTAQGIKNQAMFDSVAQAGIRNAQSMAAAGASNAELQGNLHNTYNGLIAAAGQFGITGGEAEALARKVLGIPDGVSIDSWMADEAKRMAEATKGAVDAIPPRKDVAVVITYSDIGRDEAMARRESALSPRATGGRIPGFADGGQLPTTGPGTGVTDGFLGISSAGVPVARVDAGEWIIKRSSSDRYNRELAAINAGTFPKLPGYANGSRAGREYSAQSLGYAPYRSNGPVAGGTTFGDVNISQQSDPVATWHEFSRRTNMRQP